MIDPVPSSPVPGASDVLDLALGHPGEDLLPVELMRAAAAAAFETGGPSLLQYGEERGREDLREALAGFLSAEDGRPTGAERLFLTSGASTALDHFCTLYTRPGDVVLTAEPTYHLALEIFADHGLEAVGLPSDEEGPYLDAGTARATGGRAKMLYLVPSFANPSGATLGPARRAALLDAAREHGLWVVADEVYRFLAFEGPPPPSLAGPGEERVVALGSFSKILAPGLRLGWVDAAEPVLRRFEDSGLLRSGGGLNPLMAAQAFQIVREGRLADHLVHLRREFGRRAAALTDELVARLPEAELTAPSGGYFVWLRLPGRDARRILPAARSHGVGYLPGTPFSPTGGLNDRFRLSFAHYDPTRLRTAARRFADALQSEVS